MTVDYLNENLMKLIKIILKYYLNCKKYFVISSNTISWFCLI